MEKSKLKGFHSKPKYNTGIELIITEGKSARPSLVKKNRSNKSFNKSC